MTARMLATLALALGLTVYAGCSGDTGTKDTADTDTTGDDDDDNNPDTTETALPGPEYFVPAIITTSAYFGYDLATNTLIDVTATYGTISPAIEIHIGTADWDAAGLDPSLTDLYCVVQYPLTDPTFASWAQADGYYYGVDYDQTVPHVTNCTIADGYDVDPEWTAGYADLGAVFSGAWGVAFGDITPTAQDSADLYGYTYIPEGSFFGSTMNDGALGYAVEDQLAVASELDGDNALTGNILPAADVNPGNGIVTAFYETVNTYAITFGP